jgi:co-chaperonin GroES (HSP10)
MMKQLIGDFLLVRPFPRSISDIIETPGLGIDRGRPNMDGRGVVVKVGPGKKKGDKRNGFYGPLELQPGDQVAFEDHKAYPKDPTEPDLWLMQAADCVILEREISDYVTDAQIAVTSLPMLLGM